MSSLRVNNWQDWEDICKYLMQYLIKKNIGIDVTYVSYGSQGQSQHGVDLIPADYSAPANVAQCKHILGNLTWKTVEAELKKTDTYPNLIKNYCVLTTGSRDTSVQNALNNGKDIYTRTNGQQFKVHVFYLDQFKVQEIIPMSALQRFFPDVFPVLQQTGFMSNSANEYIESLAALKSYIPQVITTSDLTWLESWDFSQGYVFENDYNKFYDLYIEHDRTLHGVNGIQDWLHQGNRISHAKTLLAGEQFYYALSVFVESVSNNIIGHSLEDGTPIYWISDLPSSDQTKITNQWHSNAHYLAQIYRQSILGESIEI